MQSAIDADAFGGHKLGPWRRTLQISRVLALGRITLQNGTENDSPSASLSRVDAANNEQPAASGLKPVAVTWPRLHETMLLAHLVLSLRRCNHRRGTVGFGVSAVLCTAVLLVLVMPGTGATAPVPTAAPTTYPVLWESHDIYTGYGSGDNGISVFAIDLDDDGDIDVLSASAYDDTIAWHENLGGSGGSWSYHEISTAANYALSVFAIDLDDDGDIDVLSASASDGTIAWYANLDGSGASWSYHAIITTANGARSVFAIDLDGDGDVDVLSASMYDDTIAWCANLDGSGESWSCHDIYTAADEARSVFAIDLDGDGDVDALSASRDDDTIAWYENLDGSGGSWSYHEISTTAEWAMSVFAIDLDGDGDVDVLSATRGDGTIAWYENLDGSGRSWSYHEISTAASMAYSVFALDVDGDGDIDVLSAWYYGTIAWHENLDGSGGSWSYQEISTAADLAHSVFAIDLDGDGDIDVLSALMSHSSPGGIVWWVRCCVIPSCA